MFCDIYNGDALQVLKNIPDESINMCVTSPPYYALRDYGVEGQIGLEETPEQYINKLVEVFREVHRVLKNDGTLWVNIGDSYWGSGSRGFDFTNTFTEKSKVQQGSKGTVDLHNIPRLVGNAGEYKNKDLVGIPWQLAFALRKDGWWLRQDIVWAKPNNMPESVTDRCTKSHEYIFLLSKSPKYYFDHIAIQEPANYDGRKDIYSKGSAEYNNSEIFPSGGVNTLAKEKHARWQVASGIKFGGSKYGDNDSDNFQTYSGNEWTPSVKENGDEVYYVRNKRDVWSIPTANNKFSHFATFPTKLVEPCVLAGCPEGGVVLDPFNGSGTTGVVALQNNRNYVGIELNAEYIDITKRRLQNECGKCEFSNFILQGNKYHSEVSIYEQDDLIS